MPVDRGSIDGQLRDIGEGEHWWEQREFRDLPHVLRSDERIRGIVNGRLLGTLRSRVLPAGRWLMVATDQRLICLRKERFGRQQVEVPLTQITRMRQRSRVRTVQLALNAAGRTLRIRVPKAHAFRFIGALTESVPQGAAPAAALAPATWWSGDGPVAALYRGLLSPVAPQPDPDRVTRAELARVEATVERLEHEIDRLQQHVEFLENLLDKRPDGALSLQRRAAED